MTAEPSLALQKAIRSRLITTADLTASVPTEHMIDGTARPEMFPCIIVGDGQAVLEGHSFSWRYTRTYADVHVWTQGAGLEAVKTIAGKVWDAIGRELPVPGFLLSDGVHVTGARYLRDPAGDFGHAIITIEALMGQQL